MKKYNNTSYMSDPDEIDWEFAWNLPSLNSTWHSLNKSLFSSQNSFVSSPVLKIPSIQIRQPKKPKCKVNIDYPLA